MSIKEEIRILLVDDQDLIRESLHIVLDMDPELKVVGMAENGLKALEMCEELSPDVVLMDIHMPVMDGVAATQKIKAQYPHIRVIVLTTFQEVDYVVGAISGGAEGYLLKAIHPRELISGIKWVQQGGSLIPQDIAQMLVSQLKEQSNETTQGQEAAPPSLLHKRQDDLYGLSERELQVLECIANGLNNREIAEKLYLSEGTVKNYISSIYSKLDVRDRIQAARKAQDEGMI
ncbi:response regulator [Marinicrinis sediminis]|uniref:Response regulator n=1 Tax=Marinicrinis sediminis TaxID=1652465 RepID=A0ABW5R6X8_9BACL